MWKFLQISKWWQLVKKIIERLPTLDVNCLVDKIGCSLKVAFTNTYYGYS